MFYLYILESEVSGRLYIGQTNDLQDRLHRHNSNENLATKNKGPWKVLFFFGVRIQSGSSALGEEIKILEKSLKGKRVG
jgi:putative endonuclease